MDDATRPRRNVTVVLFDGFELLDVFGPVELLSMLPEDFAISYAGPSSGPVRSSQGAEVVADQAYGDAAVPDIVLVPGGRGTRTLVSDDAFVAWLGRWAAEAELITSVCTGSGLPAAAGLLDGYRATSNKRAFGWASAQGDAVDWVGKARWVQDRNRWTSSGVAAGIDMTAALVASLLGEQAAEEAAEAIEIELHRDADWDPFAEKNGLA